MSTNEYAEVFKEETFEILEELEGALLELESNPSDSDLIAKVFRAIHTIKGSGAMFGFELISSFAHEVENAYDLVREGEIHVDKQLIDLTLMARDFIRQNLESDEKSIDESILHVRDDIITRLHQFTATAKKTPENSFAEPPESLSQEVEIDESGEDEPDNEPAVNKKEAERDLTGENTFRIRFKPEPQIQDSGTDLLQLFEELNQLGLCHAVAHIGHIPTLEELEPTDCYVSWVFILTTHKQKNDILDLFIFVANDAEVVIDMIDSSDGLDSPDYKKVGNILVETGKLNEEEIETIVSHKKKLGELLVEEGVVEAEEVESALVEQRHVREVRKKRQDTEIASSLRVSSEKVDLLVNLVGELVTLQARLSQLSHIRNDSELISIAEEVERITWELRDNSMEMRMLPIGSTFSRFKRLVRDLSNNLGKEVELTTEGGDTELDKTVIEKLNDPLVHIIRNSIDHGVESPEVRKKRGKIAAGNVHLNAFHSGSNVVIQVTDDGNGLDIEKIRKKALEKGVISPDQEISDHDTYKLIFEPGFSTAKEVSDVSGRGVGMDVVKRNIEALRGSIDIDSEKGEGTTFTLNIPLTLAIIDGLLVQVGEEHFVFPLSLVENCIEIPHSDIAGSKGQHYVNVRGEIVPYIYLRDNFDIPGECPVIEQIVITDIEKKRVGFVVDHVIGGHQTVIKSLGKVYRNIEGISGATILGDGTIALIMDVPKLVSIAGLAKKRIRSRLKESERNV